MSARGGVPATLAAAHRYAALGWPAFVLSPGKVPLANCGPCRTDHVSPAQMEACACLVCHGFYRATLDPGRLAAIIRRYPRGLLAIRTGKPSGLAVVDADTRHGGLETMRQLARDGMLPRTVTQRTGGGGYHLLYRHPGSRIPSVPGGGGPGVDIKADGGYIVAAPSIHPRTREPYEWLTPPEGPLAPLPAAWAERLTPRPPGPVMPAIPPGRPGAYGAAALQREIAELESALPGSRNDALNKAGFALYQLAAAGLLDEAAVTARLWRAAAANGSAAKDPGSVRRTIASARRAGLAQPRGRTA
jgi:hypothetical protein